MVIDKSREDEPVVRQHQLFETEFPSLLLQLELCAVCELYPISHVEVLFHCEESFNACAEVIPKN